MRSKRMSNLYRVPALVLCFTFAFILPVAVSHAATRGEINASVSAAMDRFNTQVSGSNAYIKGALGVLVMPNITKVGFVLGGTYGQGALLVDGKTVDYYSLAEGSVGWQIGAKKYDMVILFMTDEALANFRIAEGWEAGVDAEVTLIEVGAEVSVETLRSQHSIAGFVFDQKGLMGGVSVKGAKFTKIEPD